MAFDKKAYNKVYNKDWYRRKGKAHSLKSRYGITVEEFRGRIDSQKNLCALCLNPFVEGKRSKLDPVVDHDHSTGEIRGILHRSCNLALGIFDNLDIIDGAKAYLKKELETSIEEHW